MARCEKPPSNVSTAAPRPVAAPTARRLSSQAAPGAAVNTVGAIAGNCGYKVGVKPCDPRIRSGWAAAIAFTSGWDRVPTPGTPCTVPPR
ncbi:hypothetical protein MMAN_58320 [Mycobacterium mantenii]|uniref:Uncharacterized protein n=1 Tax=Mycobacterium mantenii TaxID=560555 RepID=A0ABM7K1G1_MYCNT|nr:hypothetical protein MMAN_58320 [Mycobacterium mantenii]